MARRERENEKQEKRHVKNDKESISKDTNVGLGVLAPIFFALLLLQIRFVLVHHLRRSGNAGAITNKINR